MSSSSSHHVAFIATVKASGESKHFVKRTTESDIVLQLQPKSDRDPMFQQQLRHPHTAQSTVDLVTAPRNQLEAMPPSKAPMKPVGPPVPMVYNPATTHPVFFTNNFHRPPFPLPMDAGLSPAAAGYVFAKEQIGSRTKL